MRRLSWRPHREGIIVRLSEWNVATATVDTNRVPKSVKSWLKLEFGGLLRTAASYLPQLARSGLEYEQQPPIIVRGDQKKQHNYCSRKQEFRRVQHLWLQCRYEFEKCEFEISVQQAVKCWTESRIWTIRTSSRTNTSKSILSSVDSKYWCSFIWRPSYGWFWKYSTTTKISRWLSFSYRRKLNFNMNEHIMRFSMHII